MLRDYLIIVAQTGFDGRVDFLEFTMKRSCPIVAAFDLGKELSERLSGYHEFMEILDVTETQEA